MTATRAAGSLSALVFITVSTPLKARTIHGCARHKWISKSPKPTPSNLSVIFVSRHFKHVFANIYNADCILFRVVHKFFALREKSQTSNEGNNLETRQLAEARAKLAHLIGIREDVELSLVIPRIITHGGLSITPTREIKTA
jgi:hypothetical protein